MIKLVFQMAHNSHKLLTELMTLPFLSPRIRNGEREAIFILSSNGQTVYLDVPDDLMPEQVAEIERIVNSHVPS